MDTNWSRRLSDNSVGVKKQYVQGPLYPTLPWIVTPGDTYSNTDLLEPVYLASESDDDIWIVDEANDDIFVISYTEPVEITPSTSESGHLLVNETGDKEVVSELGNPVELYIH